MTKGERHDLTGRVTNFLWTAILVAAPRAALMELLHPTIPADITAAGSKGRTGNIAPPRPTAA